MTDEFIMDLLEPTDVTDIAEETRLLLTALLDDLEEVPLDMGGGILVKISPISFSSANNATSEESLIGKPPLAVKSSKEGLLVKPDENMKEVVNWLNCDPLLRLAGFCNCENRIE